jgi:hypothetical protein
MDLISIVPNLVRINPAFGQFASECAKNSILKHGELNFGALSAILDAGEAIADDRIGGPTSDMNEEIFELERRLYRLLPNGSDDREWLDQRLGRALANDWCDEAITPIVEALILMPEDENNG